MLTTYENRIFVVIIQIRNTSVPAIGVPGKNKSDRHGATIHLHVFPRNKVSHFPRLVVRTAPVEFNRLLSTFQNRGNPLRNERKKNSSEKIRHVVTTLKPVVNS